MDLGACSCSMYTLLRDAHGVVMDPMMVRQIAVDAVADPRTVVRVLRGEQVRGQVGARIRARLVELGLCDAE